MSDSNNKTQTTEEKLKEIYSLLNSYTNTANDKNSSKIFSYVSDAAKKADAKYEKLYSNNLNANPFESETGKQIMKQYLDLGNTASQSELADGAADNGGNPDSYAAANANRQKLAYTQEGTRTVLDEHKSRITSAANILKQWGVDVGNYASAMQDNVDSERDNTQFYDKLRASLASEVIQNAAAKSTAGSSANTAAANTDEVDKSEVGNVYDESKWKISDKSTVYSGTVKPSGDIYKILEDIKEAQFYNISDTRKAIQSILDRTDYYDRGFLEDLCFAAQSMDYWVALPQDTVSHSVVYNGEYVGSRGKNFDDMKSLTDKVMKNIANVSKSENIYPTVLLNTIYDFTDSDYEAKNVIQAFSGISDTKAKQIIKSRNIALDIYKDVEEASAKAKASGESFDLNLYVSNQIEHRLASSDEAIKNYYFNRITRDLY